MNLCLWKISQMKITDEFLYEKYKLSDGEIELVESTIKPMDID